MSGLTIEVLRKDIKHLHLAVYPPAGRVRVAAPRSTSDETLRLAVIDKLGWIKRQRLRFDGQVRQTQREMVTGESHFYLGRRYRLRVVHTDGPAQVRICGSSIIQLAAGKHLDASQRLEVLQRWYRKQLRELVPPLLTRWEKKTKLKASDWRIKRMRTRWGTCSTHAGRIWLNLELAKKPVECLEYIIVHELVHLVERHHNVRFMALMDRHMPKWRLYKEMLNAAPLAHEEWRY
ncbi:MAG: SprT family zinc-dependent metalloprotease [Pseudomonadota bacterium]